MDIDRVGSHVPYGQQIKNSIGTDPKVKKTTDDLSPTEPESPPDIKSDDDTQDDKGVIQLLQQGHFNGVADVRLRIVHSEKLLALEQQQFQTIATEKVDGLLAMVGAAVETMPGNNESTAQPIEESAVLEPLSTPEILTEDAFTQFTQAVNAAKDEFLNSQTSSKETLVDNINSAFQSFVELLARPSEPTSEILVENEIMTNPTTEPDSANPDIQEKDVTVEPTEESPSVFESFVENLEAVFAEAMDKLVSNLDEVKVLPELSEPNGNGVAYEKFLAIYNEL